MNILLISDMYPGGDALNTDPAEYALHRFCRQWVRTHCVVVCMPVVLVPGKKLKIPKKRSYQVQNVQVIRPLVWKFPWRPWFLTGFMKRKIRKTGIDFHCVIGHLGFNLNFARRMADSLNRPLVCGVHAGDLLRGETMLTAGKFKEIFARCSLAACRSIPVYQRFCAAFPELRHKSWVAFSGVERYWLSGSERAATKACSLVRQHKVRIVSACKLIPLKNIAHNLYALAELDPAIDWQYLIAGTGPLKRELENLSEKLGISARVVFTGRLNRHELLAELKRSHLFLLVSAPETFGLVYLEAMAAGSLVLGARGHGIDGIVRHKKNGFLLPPGDAAAIRGCIEDAVLKFSEKETAEIARRSYATARLYTEERAAAHYLRGIRRIMENKPESL